MTTFAEKHIRFADGQTNVAELPHSIMQNGFIPATRDAPGMPLPAQYLNWLFRDLYRKINQLLKHTDLQNPEVVQSILHGLSLAHSLLPVGVPLAWAHTIPPTGWLRCDGARFDRQRYPQLAKIYPNSILPDLRGEFIQDASSQPRRITFNYIVRGA